MDFAQFSVMEALRVMAEFEFGSPPSGATGRSSRLHGVDDVHGRDLQRRRNNERRASIEIGNASRNPTVRPMMTVTAYRLVIDRCGLFDGGRRTSIGSAEGVALSTFPDCVREERGIQITRALQRTTSWRVLHSVRRVLASDSAQVSFNVEIVVDRAFPQAKSISANLCD